MLKSDFELNLINNVKYMIEQHLIESYNKILLEERSLNEQNGSGSFKKILLPKLSMSKEDSLSRYGYKLSKSPNSRKRALKKAARSRGTLSVLRRVNLISNYSKSVPINYDKLREDVEYLKNIYAVEKINKVKKNLKSKSKSKSRSKRSKRSKK